MSAEAGGLPMIRVRCTLGQHNYFDVAPEVAPSPGIRS